MSGADNEANISDLLGERLPDTDTLTDQGEDETRTEKKDLSSTALQVDKWGMNRGTALATDFNDNQKAKTGFCTAFEVADAHAALFDSKPRLADNPSDKLRSAWYRQLLDIPEYRALHRQTCLDPDMAAIGAADIVANWHTYQEEQEEEETRREERQKRGEPDSEGSAEPGTDQEPIAAQIERIRSTASAVSAAATGVETMQAIGAGLGMGEGGTTLDRDRLAKAFMRIRNNHVVQAIFQMAGRMRVRARSLQARKLSAQHGEITGLTLGGEIESLVPSELALVAGAVPELELLALHRLSERRATSYRHKRREPVARGPIVVCVDESGSMNGPKIIAAKALALTMAWIARQQHRWCALVSFSGNRDSFSVILPPTSSELNDTKLIAWLQHMYNGGTILDVPLDIVPHTHWSQFVEAGMQRGKADHIIITDAEVDVQHEMLANYKAWAALEHVKTYGIIIGTSTPGCAPDVFDRYWMMNRISLDAEGVEEMMSL